MRMERLAKLIYPAQCLTCDEMIEVERGLCPTCWRDTPFIVDHPCDCCGRPLIGDARCGDLCDDCHSKPRGWQRGRAAMLYADNARRIVLGLKHGDRTDLARPAGRWLADAARDIATEDMIVAPVPLHWFRLMRRRYNQSALLSQWFARELAQVFAVEHMPDLLKRVSATSSLDGMNVEQRRDTVAGTIKVHGRRAQSIQGRTVLLVDDVMTTGATLEQCTQACLLAGAKTVNIATLARVASER